MAALTDEILMVYADGLLDAEAAAQIEALLKADPGARARVSMFRATGRVLSEPYDEVLREPVPARLTGFVMNYGKERQDSPAPASQAPEGPMPHTSSLASRRRQLLGLWAAWKDRVSPDGAGWRLAAASAVTLIVGVTAGFLLRGGDDASGPSLTVLRKGQILAAGVLHQVLETEPSSNREGRTNNEGRAEGRSQDSMVVRAALTFKAKDGSYCREYEIAAPHGQFAGLACREASGRWAVEAHAALEAQTSAPHPSVGREALNAAVDARIEGDAFGKDEEEAAIKSGWK